MYIGAFIINAVIFGTVIIAPISAAIPTADGMVEALAQTPFDAAIILPSNVRELSQSPSLLDICVKKLKVLFSGGGDLPQDVGNGNAPNYFFDYKIPLGGKRILTLSFCSRCI